MIELDAGLDSKSHRGPPNQSIVVHAEIDRKYRGGQCPSLTADHPILTAFFDWGGKARTSTRPRQSLRASCHPERALPRARRTQVIRIERSRESVCTVANPDRTQISSSIRTNQPKPEAFPSERNRLLQWKLPRGATNPKNVAPRNELPRIRSLVIDSQPIATHRNRNLLRLAGS